MLTTLPKFLARLGVASCFLGFGVWELVAPTLWTTYVPAFAGSMMNPVTLVLIHGALLTIAALGVLSGRHATFFTGLSFLIMLEICFEIFFQEGFTDVFIRDVSIFLFTAALFADAYGARK